MTGRNLLKQWFSTAKKPTQGQFWEWIDSFWHKQDTINITDINGLPDALARKAPSTSLISREYANIAARDAETDFSTIKFAFVFDASDDPNATAPYALYYRANDFWYIIPGSNSSTPTGRFTYQFKNLFS